MSQEIHPHSFARMQKFKNKMNESNQIHKFIFGKKLATYIITNYCKNTPACRSLQAKYNNINIKK